MMRAAALLGFVAITLFAQEPNKDPDSFDIEPPLLIPNREDERLSNPQPGTAPAREVDLAKLEEEMLPARSASAKSVHCRNWRPSNEFCVALTSNLTSLMPAWSAPRKKCWKKKSG